MGNDSERIHPYAPVFRDVSDVQKHAEIGIAKTNDIIDGTIPDGLTEDALAEQADQAFLAASAELSSGSCGGNYIRRVSAAEIKLDKWRALVKAISPEGGVVDALGLSASAVAKSAVVSRANQASTIERGLLVAKNSVYGSVMLSIAASQPLEGVIPGVSQARRLAGRLARTIM